MATITDYEMIQQYLELMNDSYDPIIIGHCTFYAGDIVRKMDPIAFRVGLSKYADNLAEDGILVEGYTA